MAYRIVHFIHFDCDTLIFNILFRRISTFYHFETSVSGTLVCRKKNLHWRGKIEERKLGGGRKTERRIMHEGYLKEPIYLKEPKYINITNK